MSRPFSVKLRRYEIMAGALWLVVYLFLLDDGLRLLLETLGRPDDDILLNKVYFLTGFLGTAALFHRFLADSLRPLAAQPGRFLKGILLGFFVYEFCQIGLSMIYELAVPELQIPNDNNLQSLAGQNLPVIAAGAVLLSPVTEETLLRGLVFGSLREKSRAAAYGVSAALFAGMHVVNYISVLEPSSFALNLIVYLLPGAALCACYEYSGTVWGPILLHAAINGIGLWAMVSQGL